MYSRVPYPYDLIANKYSNGCILHVRHLRVPYPYDVIANTRVYG